MKLNRRECMQSQITGAYQIYLSYAVATLESTHLSKTPVTVFQKKNMTPVKQWQFWKEEKRSPGLPTVRETCRRWSTIAANFTLQMPNYLLQFCYTFQNHHPIIFYRSFLEEKKTPILTSNFICSMLLLATLTTPNPIIP